MSPRPAREAPPRTIVAPNILDPPNPSPPLPPGHPPPLRPERLDRRPARPHPRPGRHPRRDRARHPHPPPDRVTSTALSVADGRYTLRGQRPGGPYTVTVTRLGFREFTREDIEPLLGQFVDLDVTLVPDAIEIEALVVEAEPDPEFNPGRIGISTLVTSEVLRELPTRTRNFLDFALSPLVRTSEEGVSVAGASCRFNSLNIDGALNQDVHAWRN